MVGAGVVMGLDPGEHVVDRAPGHDSVHHVVGGIGDVASRAGVATSALRYYEDRGLITSLRTEGNQRRYPRSVLRTVSVIRAAQEVGLTLLFLVTLRVWLRDETDDLETTRRFLRRRLEAADTLLASWPRPRGRTAAEGASGNHDI